MIEEGVPSSRDDLRRVQRALRKLHRIGFVETRTMNDRHRLAAINCIGEAKTEKMMTMKYKPEITLTRGDVAEIMLGDMGKSAEDVAIFWRLAQKLAAKKPIAKKPAVRKAA